MREVKFVLDVYGSGGGALFTIEAGTPFSAMSKGDIVQVDPVAGFAASSVSGRIGHVLSAIDLETFEHKIVLRLEDV
jgi:hypothetical protein